MRTRGSAGILLQLITEIGIIRDVDTVKKRPFVFATGMSYKPIAPDELFTAHPTFGPAGILRSLDRVHNVPEKWRELLMITHSIILVFHIRYLSLGRTYQAAYHVTKSYREDSFQGHARLNYDKPERRLRDHRRR